MKTNAEFMKEFETAIEEVGDSMIEEKLALVTDKQREFFFKMYPQGVSGIPQEKKAWAYSQICRSLTAASPTTEGADQ